MNKVNYNRSRTLCFSSKLGKKVSDRKKNPWNQGVYIVAGEPRYSQREVATKQHKTGLLKVKNI